MDRELSSASGTTSAKLNSRLADKFIRENTPDAAPSLPSANQGQHFDEVRKLKKVSLATLATRRMKEGATKSQTTANAELDTGSVFTKMERLKQEQLEKVAPPLSGWRRFISKSIILQCPVNVALIVLTLLGAAAAGYTSSKLGIRFDLSTNAFTIPSHLTARGWDS